MSWAGILRRLGVELDGQDIDVYSGNARVRGYITKKTTVTNITTAGAATYTAAQLLGGIITRDPNGLGRSDVTPTATQIKNAIKDCKIGDSFEFLIKNTADAIEVITVTAGSGVTLSGTMTIGQNETKRFYAVVTAVTTPAVTIYNAGGFTS